MLCEKCGADFVGTSRRKLCGRCRNLSRNRPHYRAPKEREFWGIDGEGITNPDGSHDYVLLTAACGDRNVDPFVLHKDGARLSTGEIFDFLFLIQRRRSDACFVGYYLGYDFAQWLRDLPAERAVKLLTAAGIASRKRRAAKHLPPFPVRWQGWEFDTMGLRKFRLRPAGGSPDAGWMTICDAGPFWQTSFLNAIDPAKRPPDQAPLCTAEEYAAIVKGKGGRGADGFDADMIRYNLLECQTLARLMAELDGGLRAEGLKLKKTAYFGPGQAAQSWLRKIEAPTGERLRQQIPQEFREAAKTAYFGGWFECFWHGPVKGKSYEYDINSAYPFIMSGLPCLLHGRYFTGGTFPATSSRTLALVHATVSGRNRIVGTMLHRRPNGTILRPLRTSGWFWWHELDAARKAGFVDHVKISRILSYVPCDCQSPLAGIADLYSNRLAIGKDSPRGKGQKLIYNSCYGKFAQSIGEPVFANPVYASLITAGCRTMILDAIRTHPDGARSLLMVATDGVTFRRPHPGLRISSDLGLWSTTLRQNLSLFMPGMYWDDAGRSRLVQGLSGVAIKTRGINAAALGARLLQIDRAWSEFPVKGWPKFDIPIPFAMITPKQALARNKWELCGAVVLDGSRSIDSNPNRLKRIASRPGRSRPIPGVWGPDGKPLPSTPYDGTFGEELREVDVLAGIETPDGDFRPLLREALLG